MSPIHCAIRKYGVESFDICVLDTAGNQHDLNILEKLYIVQRESREHSKGYNILEGGSGGKQPPELLAKLSQARKGRVMSPEWRARMSAAQKKRWIENPPIRRSGWKHSEETKQKMAAAALGKKKSATHKHNLSIARIQMYAANPESHPWLGRQHSAESKLKIGAASKDRIPWNKKVMENTNGI